MYEQSDILSYISNLDNSFVLTGSEVVYITKVHQLLSSHIFIHTTYLYTEIHITVDAISYSLHNKQLIKENVHSLYLTLGSPEIIKPTEENIAVLLVDKCTLTRSAITDWYKKIA